MPRNSAGGGGGQLAHGMSRPQSADVLPRPAATGHAGGAAVAGSKCSCRCRTCPLRRRSIGGALLVMPASHRQPTAFATRRYPPLQRTFQGKQPTLHSAAAADTSIPRSLALHPIFVGVGGPQAIINGRRHEGGRSPGRLQCRAEGAWAWGGALAAGRYAKGRSEQLDRLGKPAAFGKPATAAAAPPPPLADLLALASVAPQLLEATKIEDVCKKDQKIVLLEHNQTISEALKALAKHNILSAPMVGGAGGRACRSRLPQPRLSRPAA